VAFATDKHLIRAPVRAEDLLQTKFVTAALKDLQLEHFWTQVSLVPQTFALAAKSHD
jgi:hypothetical protein